MTRYYYAGGRRIALEPDDQYVAVDEKAAGAAGLPLEAGNAPVRRLPGGVTVSPRSSLSEARLERLSQAGALRSVYRRDRSMLVALPEIRVEYDNPKQRAAVKAAIPQAPCEAEVSDESAHGLVLRPTSGRSDDALVLANYIYEQAHPAAASVRFVQFVPKLDVQP
ncbi:MAG: hypothetical protein ABIR94_24010 [Rubrivivax sp.]